MTLSGWLFLKLGFLIALLALACVQTKHILRSAVYLMAVLILSAGLYLLLDAEFLAGVQILVYVGGIVVLLVYAVMLTRTHDLLEDRPSLKRKLFGFAAAGSFFVGGLALLSSSPLAEPVALSDTVAPDGLRAIGRSLLDTGPGGYVVPFELISLLLLAVLIGGIVIARKRGQA